MPLLTTRANGALNITRLGGGGGEAYWLATYSLSSAGSIIRDLSVDSSKNVWFVCDGNNGVRSCLDFVKLNSSGIKQTDFSLSGDRGFYPNELKFDSTNNYLYCSYYTDWSPNQHVCKISTSGTLAWDKHSNYSMDAGSRDGLFYNSTADKVYHGGNYYNTANGYGECSYLDRHNTSDGALANISRRNWFYGGNNLACSVQGITGYVDPNSLASLTFVAINGLGTPGLGGLGEETYLNWHVEFQSPNQGIAYVAVAVDPSYNLYGGGYNQTWGGVSNGYSYVAKHSTEDGSFVWQRKFYSGSKTTYLKRIATDTLNNVYVVGVQTGTYNTGFIMKYNSSGVLQWQRIISRSSQHVELTSVATDINNNIYVAGYGNDGSYNRGFCLKLKTDGSQTGTYGGYTIASGSITDAAGDLSMTGTNSYRGGGTYSGNGSMGDGVAAGSSLSGTVSTTSL